MRSRLYSTFGICELGGGAGMHGISPWSWQFSYAVPLAYMHVMYTHGVAKVYTLSVALCLALPRVVRTRLFFLPPQLQAYSPSHGGVGGGGGGGGGAEN